MLQTLSFSGCKWNWSFETLWIR